MLEIGAYQLQEYFLLITITKTSLMQDLIKLEEQNLQSAPMLGHHQNIENIGRGTLTLANIAMV